MFTRIGDVDFNTVSFGAGPRTIMALGGWTGSWELWQQPFELLSSCWRCVSYDRRGSGETVAPVGSITRDALIVDTFAVLDSLGVGRCVLAGESMFARACLPEPDSGSYLRWGTGILLRSEGEVAARLLEASEAMVIDPAELALPTLIFHGTADAIVPASAGHHVASIIPGAELVLLEGAGHVPTFTQAHDVADAIDGKFGLSSS